MAEKSTIVFYVDKKTAIKVLEDIRNIFGRFVPTQPILLQCQNVSPKQLSGSIIGMPQVPPPPTHTHTPSSRVSSRVIM